MGATRGTKSAGSSMTQPGQAAPPPAVVPWARSDWGRHSRHGNRISLTDSLGLFGHPRLLSSILVILKRRVHGAKQGFLAEWLRQEANGACPQGPLSRVFIPMARDEDDRDMVRSSQLTL